MTHLMPKSLSIAVAMVAFGAVAQAQVEQATITGTVLDEAGGVVPGARVVAVQAETQVSRETLTNGAGHYAIPYLPVGTYELTAELKGFSRARVTGVRLRVGLLATVDLTLRAGGLAAEVTVTASVAQIDLQSPALGSVVGSRQILELPIVGRNPYSLVTLAPGVVDRGNAGTGPLVNGARSALGEDIDPPPVVKLFTPDAGATWLLTELDPADPDRAFGLCDLGLGGPELGWVSLTELATVRGRLGLPLERDLHFVADRPLSAYAKEAQFRGGITA